jgi:thiol-disulfide isomerase/thioredoxin
VAKRARHRNAAPATPGGAEARTARREQAGGRRAGARQAGRRARRGWGARHWGVAGAVAVGVVALVVLVIAHAGTAPANRPAAGDFTLVAYQGQDVLGGDRVRFSHVLGEGKPVVLNFFAGACAPCSVEMPGLQRVADAYAGRVNVVGVDVGPLVGMGSHQDAAILLRSLGIRYPAAYAVDPAPLTLYVQGMPTTVVFDAHGQVATRFTGAVTEPQLEQALAGIVGG